VGSFNLAAKGRNELGKELEKVIRVIEVNKVIEDLRLIGRV
jgi:hypothetical protein